MFDSTRQGLREARHRSANTPAPLPWKNAGGRPRRKRPLRHLVHVDKPTADNHADAPLPYLAQSLSCGIQYTFYNIGYT